MRTINRLTPLDVASLQKGLHADGNGLYLQVGSKSARSWVFRYKTNARLRELGLGSARSGLAHAAHYAPSITRSRP